MIRPIRNKMTSIMSICNTPLDIHIFAGISSIVCAGAAVATIKSSHNHRCYIKISLASMTAILVTAIPMAQINSDLKAHYYRSTTDKKCITSFFTAMLETTITTLTAFTIDNIQIHRIYLAWIAPTILITPAYSDGQANYSQQKIKILDLRFQEFL